MLRVYCRHNSMCTQSCTWHTTRSNLRRFGLFLALLWVLEHANTLVCPVWNSTRNLTYSSMVIRIENWSSTSALGMTTVSSRRLYLGTAWILIWEAEEEVGWDTRKQAVLLSLTHTHVCTHIHIHTPDERTPVYYKFGIEGTCLAISSFKFNVGLSTDKQPCSLEPMSRDMQDPSKASGNTVQTM